MAGMARFPKTEAFILAGGKSSRMGREKAFLELAGKPILQRTADLVAPLVSGVSVVGYPDRYARFGLPICPDRWPDAGPLGGIATALAASRAAWCLILACDLPYLTEDWLIYLLGRTVASVAEAIVPETARGLEPLCASYRSTCAPTFEAALDRGVRKVTDAFAEVKVERVPENDWKQFSLDGSLFHNMNTLQDYLEAQKRLDR
jgi:molybdopterin-guanine dinucleotide biosynthesis protein A